MAERERKKKKALKREFSAGGAVYKRADVGDAKFEMRWLVAKSNPSKKYPQVVWRLPKGWLDDRKGGKLPGPFASGERRTNEDILRKAALREVEEEGGIVARIVEKITTDSFFYTDKNGDRVLKFVTFYLMEWEKDIKDGPGKETSGVEWLSLEGAKEKLSYSGEKKVLEKACLLLNHGMQSSLV